MEKLFVIVMEKNYVENFSTAEKWEVMKLMLIKGQYGQIIKMVQDGYPLTGVLLESLSRLRQKQIFNKVLENAYIMEDSAKGFLRAYFGDAEYTKFIQQLIQRQNERKKKIQEMIDLEVEEAKKHQEQEWQSKVSLGLVPEVFEYVQKKGLWSRLLKQFGEEAVYQAVLDNKRYVYDLRHHLSNKFLYAKGDFSRLQEDYDWVRRDEENRKDLIDEVLRFPGGAMALFRLVSVDVDRELVCHGYKYLFLKTNEGYSRLKRIGALKDKDLVLLYQRDRETGKYYIKKCGSLKLKAALLLGRLN